MPKKKLGLILEGGGAKGSYQVGALAALTEAGIVFDGVAGTSIGALNGAVLVSESFKELEKIWDEVNVAEVFELDEDWLSKFKNRDFDLDLMTYAGKKLVTIRKVIRESYLTATEFVTEKLVEEKIRASKMDFGFVTYNLSKMKPVEVMKEEVPEGKLVDYIIASATFPIFPPRIIDDEKFIDGGVYDNLPINLLAKNGYRKMIVIRTNTADKMPKRRIERNDLDLTYIVPKIDLGRPMAFNEEKFVEMRKMGYNDTREMLDAGLIK